MENSTSNASASSGHGTDLGSPWGQSNRREFLALAAKGALALGITSSLSGCVIAAAGTKKLDFRDDFGILNFAYALETLESRFYKTVCEHPARDFRPGELRILEDIRDHEIAHARFLKRSLQILRVEVPASVWPGIDFNSRASVLAAAKNFEDLGVAGYNGAGTRLRLAEFLTIAGKIVSVEARHAAVLRDMINPNSRDFAGDDVIDANGMDRALEPGEVLAQAQKYFAEPYQAVGL